MASKFIDVDQGGTSHKLVSDKSVTQVIDPSIFDTGETKVAVNAGANIPDQEGVAGFGDEKFTAFGFWSFGEIFFQGGLGSVVNGNGSSLVRFVSVDFNFVVVEINIGEIEVSHLGNAHAGLEKNFNNSGNANIAFAGIPESSILKFGENPRRFDVVFGMTDLSGRIAGNNSLIF